MEDSKLDFKMTRYFEVEFFFDKKDSRKKALLLSTRSSKLLCIDASLFELMQTGRMNLIKDSNFISLKDAKLLIPKDENELQTVLEENQIESRKKDEIYLVFQPSAQCQLGCGYCGQSHKNKNYSQETLVAIPDFVRKTFLKNGHTYKSIYVCWFGAEPLTGLATLRLLSNDLQVLAKEYDLSYQAKMVTNGLLLKAHVAEDLIINHKIKFFEITLDGDALSHDERRFTKGGDGTFNTIFANVVAVGALPHNFTLSIRCNVDERNHERIVPLLHKLKEQDLEKKIRFYIAPIHSWGNDAHNLAAEQREFADWEIETFIEMEHLGFSTSLIPSRNPVTCLAVNESGLLIDPLGSIYNCTEVSLVPSYEVDGRNQHDLGNVTDGNIDRERKKIFADFFQDLLEEKYQCSSCHILPVCGGRCPKEWNEGRIPCPPMKFNMKERMMLSYLRSVKNMKETIFDEASCS